MLVVSVSADARRFGWRLRLGRGDRGSLLTDLPAAGTFNGLEQLVAVPDLQDLLADVDVDLVPGSCFTQTDLLP